MQNPERVREHVTRTPLPSRNKTACILCLKPRGDAPRGENRGISGPYKKVCKKKFIKKLFLAETCFGIFFYKGVVSYSKPSLDNFGEHGYYPVGTVASFTCDAGYSRSGEEFRTCQANQTWSQRTPTCTLSNYRPQTKFAKVMFLHLYLSYSVHRGAYMAGGVHFGEGHVWQGSMHAGGMCVAGGMRGRGGACMAGETATAAGDTHPTGMHSCYIKIFVTIRNVVAVFRC